MADEINGFEGLYWDGTVPFSGESTPADDAESAKVENPVNVVVNQTDIHVDGDSNDSIDHSGNKPGSIDKVADFFKGMFDTGETNYLPGDPLGLPAYPAPHEGTWADPDELTEQQKNDGLTLGIDPLGGTWIVNSNDDPIPEETDRVSRKLEYISSYTSALGKTFVYDPNSSVTENMHKALELGGFAPGVGAAADLANAVLYLSEGNYKEAGYSAIAAVPLAGDAVAAGRITNKAGKVVEGSKKEIIRNPIPVDRIFARAMPEKFAKQIQEGKALLSPQADSWVTAAEDLKGITSIEEVAKKLTLVEKDGALRLKSNAIVEFRLKNPSGIASPINRLDPGFIGGGKTLGGAREYIIPSNAEIEIINIRILE